MKDVCRAGEPLYPVRSDTGEMFGRIARTYDVLNHLLSLGRDWAWRRRAARQLDASRCRKVIDLATGTGDMLIALLREHPDIAEATGLDISESMLAICREKLRKRNLADRATILRADASAVPVPHGTFDAATMAFGIRNTSDVNATLKEIHRILKPGGTALILEFSLPPCPIVRWFYLGYLRHVVPLIGSFVSGDRQAYRYLNTSIESFRRPVEFCGLMQIAGFRDVSPMSLTCGVATIYAGVKMNEGGA